MQINDGEKFDKDQMFDLSKWSFGKLKDVIRQLEKLPRRKDFRDDDDDVDDEEVSITPESDDTEGDSKGNSQATSDSDHIPRFDFGEVIEKQQLIDAAYKLMKLHPEVYIEDEATANANPLKTFGRRLTHAYDRKLKHWPVFKRVEEMCKLKALSNILDGRRQFVRQQAESAEKVAKSTIVDAESARKNAWVEIVLETRQQLLQQEMGIYDFDPGKCWTGSGQQFSTSSENQSEFTFRNCCNGLTDDSKPYASCFDQTYTYERCCPDPSKLGFERKIVRGLASQLVSMAQTVPKPDVHQVTNLLDAYFKYPNKAHALTKVVETLVREEGAAASEDPSEAVPRVVKRLHEQHRQFERDMGLLRNRIEGLGEYVYEESDGLAYASLADQADSGLLEDHFASEKERMIHKSRKYFFDKFGVFDQNVSLLTVSQKNDTLLSKTPNLSKK